MKKKIKIILNFFIYLVIIIYSVEILLFTFSSDLQKSLVNIKDKRIELAKKKNLKYDIREPETVFFEDNKKIKNLSIPFYYSPLSEELSGFKKAKKNNQIIPFRGPINKKTLSCAEDLNYRIIENDKYGFKNSNSIYDGNIDIILLGGSYAEGFCYNSDTDIAGNLNDKGMRTLNLGVATTGPLVSLAVLKEFTQKYKTKHVIYFYYERTSLENLNWEIREKGLVRYLNRNYKIDYLDKIDEINFFLNSVEKENIKIILDKFLKKKEIKENKSNFYIESIQDIIEINILRNKFKNLLTSNAKTHELDTFYKVLNEIKYETSQLDAKFTFVYIPSWDRFFNKSSSSYSTMKLRNVIKERLYKDKINVVDLTDFFSESENISSYYPLGYVGHFNEKGYNKISEIIRDEIFDQK